jgi:hypothetical protein
MEERAKYRGAFHEVETADPGGDRPVPLIEELNEVHRLISTLHVSLSELRRDQEFFEKDLENIAHEFQIRLQALYATSELLLDALADRRPIAQPELDDAKEMLNGLKRLNVLVQNLSTGLGEYEIKPVDVAELVESSVSLYEAEAKNKLVWFEVDLQMPAMIEGSGRHLSHVFNNLVSNAVKYSYRGSRERMREVRIRGKETPREYIVSVQNLGIGILASELDSIFEKRYRGVLTVDESRTGAGLGLHIVKEIVESHGGRVSVTSYEKTSGYLTTLTVRLLRSVSRVRRIR